MSQSTDIIAYIDRHGSISALECAIYLFCNDFHRRKTDLRNKGYEFNEKWRGSGQKKYKRYSIKKRPKKARK